MKKILFLLAMLPMMIACDQKETVIIKEKPVENIVDSLSQYLSKLDSINNSGHFYHLSIHEIGSIKGVDVDVYDIDVRGMHLQYVNLRQEVGSRYYTKTEEVRILGEEIKYLQEAANVIIENSNKKVNVRELYSYITKDGFRVYSAAAPSSSVWKIAFNLDYRKNESEYFTSVTSEELKEFMSLINKAEQKINELQK